MTPRGAHRHARAGARVVADADREHASTGRRLCFPACSTTGWTRSVSTSRSSIPGTGLLVVTLPGMADEDLRRSAARAYNLYNAEMFAPFSDRLTPAAVIPMHTPEEAIEELDFAIGTLGLKVALLAGDVLRPIPAVAREHPGVERYVFYQDCFGIDSPYDYDPVWQRCVDLRRGAHVPLGPDRLGDAGVHLAPPVQPARRVRRGRRGALQVAVLRRRHQALPRPALRVPRGRRGLGPGAVLPHARALEEAQRRGHPPSSTRRCSTRATSPS